MLVVKKPDEVPWTNPWHKATWYTVYEEPDRYIFVPKERHAIGLMTAFEAACRLATAIKCDGYEIIHRGGEAGGQVITWPYLELRLIRRQE